MVRDRSELVELSGLWGIHREVCEAAAFAHAKEHTPGIPNWDMFQGLFLSVYIATLHPPTACSAKMHLIEDLVDEFPG